jgi:hypothetical protein
MPQVRQKQCRIIFLLNWYVPMFSSAASTVNCSRGTNHNSDPLREQIEQLHAIAFSMRPSTSKAILPQWQLPRYFISALLARRETFLALH